MIEKVGNVELNYKHYAGRDLYSDGNIEEELLDISKQYRQEEWNQVIAQRASWPVLYHFSHIRENITDWLPISKHDAVLEIGSGCGAITGNLAKKAKHVTCIDLSRMRSLINANRNRDLDNIEILVGNFQDIEKDLDEKYDYITLIGVFEYSAGYIGTDEPYTKMLEIISRHLKPNGKLVIAIENRLGMKYWAGCTEDHVGKFFEGIEGYPTVSSVKTFSHKEMGMLFEKTGIFDYQMYYPYPDYKFPMAIYSDEWLPKAGELSNVEYNFDRARIRSFDEARVLDTVIKNDLFPVYSNSFLVVASLKGSEAMKARCIYAKFSNERSNDFSLRTMISQRTDGQRRVEKFATTDSGKVHIKNIYHNMKKLGTLYKNTCISVNKCQLAGDGIELEYLKGTTLEEILDHLMSAKKYDQMWAMVEKYLGVLRRTATKPFEKTKEFVEVFGDVELSEDLLCPPVNNVDAIFANILWAEDEWQMLDYEWSLSFPVPVNFQIYRAIFYYVYTRNELEALDFFGRAQISSAEMKVYREMEKSFQKYILGRKIPMRDMYASISPGVVLDVQKFMNSREGVHTSDVQIYFDRGLDFSESDSIFIKNNYSLFEAIIPVSSDVKRLRIDPCSKKCLVKVEILRGNCEKVPIMPYICNGALLGEQKIFFDTLDPYFIIENRDSKMESLHVQMQILCLDDKNSQMLEAEMMELHRVRIANEQMRQEMLALSQHREQLQNMNLELQRQLAQERDSTIRIQQEAALLQSELAQKKELIAQMEGTKVWRLYRKIKGD